MSSYNYHFKGEEELFTPALIYYEDLIERNLDIAHKTAGSYERFWPHVKTYKSSSLVKMLQARGINRFKCATIAEAEMCAISSVPDILLSYPLVGPSIGRFIQLCKKYTSSVFWAIGDDLDQLSLLGQAAAKEGLKIPFLADVNSGMDRTGVSTDKLVDFCINASKIEGLSLMGFHCYDGHIRNPEKDQRQNIVDEEFERMNSIKKDLEALGINLPYFVMGGSPTFPMHSKHSNVYLSAGTLFVQDHSYKDNFQDLEFIPAAAILCRVISRPQKNIFTVDLGHKAISADHDIRGIIVDYPEAKPLRHSEEHWVFSIDEEKCPDIGKTLFVIPSHICPTTILYPGIHVVRNGELSDYWDITARDRKINI